MRRSLTHLCLLAVCILAGISPLSAQEGGAMSVKSFYLNERDLTANTAGTMMYDQNGEVCALIKLETPLDGFTFDVGVLGVRDVRRVGGELWIYVPFGVRRMTLSHPQLGVIREYEFPVPIERARTYVMELNTRFASRVYDEYRAQEFILQVTPPDARVMINGMSVPVDSTGRVSQVLAFGLYDVLVQREDYHTVTFQQEINNELEAHYKEVVLRQDYGWLYIVGYGGESVWVDDDKVSYETGDMMKVKSGRHIIRRKKPLYKLHEMPVEVLDSAVCMIDTPEYEFYARQMEIVSENAELWVDTVRVGYGRWQGMVELGAHTFSSRNRGCRPSVRTVEVTEAGPESVSLSAPVPAFGTLSVSADPAPAQVYMDGSLLGEAPGIFTVPIGDHEVEVRRAGMDTETNRINVPEGEIISLDVHLVTTLTVNVTSYEDGVDVYIDDIYAGRTPFTVRIPAGVHGVRTASRQFKTFDDDLEFANPGTMLLPLKPRYTHKRAYYADVQVALPGSLYLGAALGLYLKNFNVEVTAAMGLTTKEIYWSSTDASKEPVAFRYRPLLAGARLGFEIPFSTRMSLTPRVGVNVVQVRGQAKGTPAYDASRAGAVSAVADVRFTCMLSESLYVKVQPEFDFAVSKTPLFERLAGVSPAIKSWADGVKISAGVGYMF